METALKWHELDEILDIPESLGDYCVRRGFTTRARVDECVVAQRQLERGGKPRRLGELLVERGYLTPEQVTEALSAQQQKIQYCPACRIQVNVPVGEAGTRYCCGRCRGPLGPVPDPARVAVVDDSALPADLNALPAEVERARREPENVLGRYILVGVLGRGGVGIVHRAWDTYLEHFVALKLLRTDLDEPAGDRVERETSLLKEARHTARLRHPRIVSVFDVGRIAGQYYISMEHVEGETLEMRCRKSQLRGKISPYYQDTKGTLRLLEEVARAVHYAHTRPEPLIHCDLKPANILIDREGHPRILDFGLARRARGNAAPTGQICGTPSYMAPEQAAGLDDKIGPRSDVYAFGSILYVLLAGRPPFLGDPLAVLDQTLHRLPMRPTMALQATGDPAGAGPRRFSHRLENLCMACLHKDPAQRPASMEEVAEALRRSATDTRRVPESQTTRIVIRRASASA